MLQQPLWGISQARAGQDNGGLGEGPVLDDNAVQEADVLQGGAAVEGTLADEVHILQVDGGELGAVLEGVAADLHDGAGQLDLGQVGQLVEGHLADVVDALGDDDLGDQRSVLAPGQAQNAVDLPIVLQVGLAVLQLLAGGNEGQNAVGGQGPGGVAGPAGGDDSIEAGISRAAVDAGAVLIAVAQGGDDLLLGDGGITD